MRSTVACAAARNRSGLMSPTPKDCAASMSVNGVGSRARIRSRSCAMDRVYRRTARRPLRLSAGGVVVGAVGAVERCPPSAAPGGPCVASPEEEVQRPRAGRCPSVVAVGLPLHLGRPVLRQKECDATAHHGGAAFLDDAPTVVVADRPPGVCAERRREAVDDDEGGDERRDADEELHGETVLSAWCASRRHVTGWKPVRG
jgi:hypothetical protein